ncbi:MAG TPA: rRNA maturation RNase YbeY [Candidatus Babeliales bacterium]|nr:rRNA maturation RNase YbeY [Candidatus Babeliales bacterium]
MILIKNTQRKISLDTKKIKLEIEKIVDFLHYLDFDIGILFTTEKVIREYNKTYRDKDKPTDVLSFPYYPHLKAGQKIKASHEDEKNLGDLIICPAYIKENFPTSFNKQLRIILVHGICHLLGYDHIDDTDFEIMQKEEARILAHLEKNSDFMG